MRLQVPFYRQSQPATCAPAALRMVLAYWGCELTEDELSIVCETDEEGTPPAGCVRGATKHGFHVDLWCMRWAIEWLRRRLPLDRAPSLQVVFDRTRTIVTDAEAWDALKEAIEAGKPVIAFTREVQREDIPGHVVVVVEVTDDEVFFNDPAEPEVNQPLSLSKQEFLTAWGDFNFLALVIP